MFQPKLSILLSITLVYILLYIIQIIGAAHQCAWKWREVQRGESEWLGSCCPAPNSWAGKEASHSAAEWLSRISVLKRRADKVKWAGLKREQGECPQPRETSSNERLVNSTTSNFIIATGRYKGDDLLTYPEIVYLLTFQCLSCKTIISPKWTTIFVQFYVNFTITADLDFEQFSVCWFESKGNLFRFIWRLDMLFWLGMHLQLASTCMASTHKFYKNEPVLLYSYIFVENRTHV